MRRHRLIISLIAVAGCLDLSALQSGALDMAMPSPDMAMDLSDMAMDLSDMAMPSPDMAMEAPDLAKPNDLSMPDLAAPPDLVQQPDMSPIGWTNVTPAMAPSSLAAIAGAGTVSGGNLAIYIVGKGATILKSTDGNSFAAAPAPTAAMADFNALWVQSATDVWVADSAGAVYEHKMGVDAAMGWVNKLSPAPMAMAQRAIFGRAATSDIVVAGDDTSKALTLTPLSGTTWVSANHMLGVKIAGVWAGATYIVVGENGKAARALTPSLTWGAIGLGPMATAANLTAVSGTADNAVWVVTSDGQLLSTDLTAMNPRLSREALQAGASFTGVWARSTTEVWIVGKASTVYMWNGTSLVDRRANLPAGYDLTGVFGDGTSVWIVGNNTSTGSGAIFRR